MFWDRRKWSDRIFVVIREQGGIMNFALGDHGKVHHSRNAAIAEAARLASKYNDGRYYVFQAISVSEVTSPRAVTRALGDSGLEVATMTSLHSHAQAE